MMVVGILTPMIGISLFLLAVIGYERVFPDPYVAPPTAIPGTAAARSTGRLTPTVEIVPRNLVPQ